MDTTKRDSLRKAVRYFYDLQKLRIQFGNRTTNLDVKIVTDKEGKEKKVKKKSTKAERDAALDTIINRLKGGDDDIEVGEGYSPPTLEEEDQNWLRSQSRMLEGLELDTKKRVEDILKTTPIYNKFLKGVKGCGPGMSGVIVSEVQMCRPVSPELLEGTREYPYTVTDINGKEWPYFRVKVQLKRKQRGEDGEPDKEVVTEKELKCFRRGNVVYEDVCPTPSALFAFAGLAVNNETGKAVRRQKGVKGNWSPFLKTKLLGVLAGCLLKAGSSYTEHYHNAKHRKTQSNWGTSAGHRHNHANRVMVKALLRDLWVAWRELEDLPVVPPYEEVYLNRTHGDHGGAPAK